MFRDDRPQQAHDEHEPHRTRSSLRVRRVPQSERTDEPSQKAIAIAVTIAALKGDRSPIDGVGFVGLRWIAPRL